MKTILYQPIFINPQAYFVFPQLYDIEKGDSFVEPANITEQLIINTLTDDPITLTVKDSNQVDFSIFAGKHIRISQYTDEGAVILGEWSISDGDTPLPPIPPGGEYLVDFDEFSTNYSEDQFDLRESHKIIVNSTKAGNYILFKQNTNVPSFKVRVTTEGRDLKDIGLDWKYTDSNDTIISQSLSEEGDYTLNQSRGKLCGLFTVNYTDDTTITIEQIPE